MPAEVGVSIDVQLAELNEPVDQLVKRYRLLKREADRLATLLANVKRSGLPAVETTQGILSQVLGVGLSQLEISRLTGISQPTLSKWARGHVPPGADGALKLRQLLINLQGEAAPVPAGEVRHAE